VSCQRPRPGRGSGGYAAPTWLGCSPPSPRPPAPSHPRRIRRSADIWWRLVSIDRAREQLEISEGRWLNAVREHAQPPPDAGFPRRRLRALADAAAQEQTAYAYAAEQAFGWKSGPPWLPPQELRPAPWRLSLASAEVWQRLDDGVGALSLARTGVSVVAIAQALGHLSAAAWELAAEIDAGAQRSRSTRAR